MLNRWDSRIEDLNLILSRLREISRRVVKRKETKGRKPKHSIADYTALIVLKEASNRTQRGAEVNINKLANKKTEAEVIKEILSYLPTFDMF